MAAQSLGTTLLGSLTTLFDRVGGAAAVVPSVVIGFAAVFLVYRWWTTKNAHRVFTRYRATAFPRAMDSLTWGAWHVLMCFKTFESDKDLRSTHRRRALACLGILGLVTVAPLLGVLLGGFPALEGHGLAFGLAGLAWSVAVEWPEQPVRDGRYLPSGETATHRAERDTATRTAIVVALDLVIYVLFRLDVVSDPTVRAALLGVALVAIADLSAVLVTLLVGAANGAPFRARP